MLIVPPLPQFGRFIHLTGHIIVISSLMIRGIPLSPQKEGCIGASFAGHGHILSVDASMVAIHLSLWQPAIAPVAVSAEYPDTPMEAAGHVTQPFPIGMDCLFTLSRVVGVQSLEGSHPNGLPLKVSHSKPTCSPICLQIGRPMKSNPRVRCFGIRFYTLSLCLVHLPHRINRPHRQGMIDGLVLDKLSAIRTLSACPENLPESRACIAYLG